LFFIWKHSSPSVDAVKIFILFLFFLPRIFYYLKIRTKPLIASKLLKNELKLQQQSVYGAKFQLKKRLIEALDKKLPKYTAESLAKKKAAATEAKEKKTTQGLSSISKTTFWKELKPRRVPAGSTHL
jgi:hypothetical protein